MKQIDDMITDNVGEWKGITLDELRMRRAVLLVKLELRTEFLKNQISVVQSTASSPVISMFSGGASKLSFLKYAFIGYKGAKLIYNLWKKRKH